MPNNPIDALQLILAARADHLARFTPDYDLTHHNAGPMAVPPFRWPFPDDQWSTGTVVEQLAKAAAYAAAEIDRCLALADLVMPGTVQS